MRWPWLPPSPTPTPQETADKARRERLRVRVETLAAEVQHLADKLEQHDQDQRRHGGTTPWPTT